MKLRISEESSNNDLIMPSFINTETISKIMSFIDVKSNGTSIKDFNMKLVYVYVNKPPNADVIVEDNFNEFYCKCLQGYLIYNIQNTKTGSLLNNEFGYNHYELQDQLSNNLKQMKINDNNILFAIITWNTFDEEQDVSISYPYSTIIPRDIINNVTDSLVNLYKFIKSKYAHKNESIMNKKLERMTFMKLSLNENVTNIPAKSKLNAVIKKYFDGDANSYSRLPWTISHGGYDLEAEIYLDRAPVCDIIYTPYYYEIRNISSDFDIAPIVKDILDSMNIEAKIVS